MEGGRRRGKGALGAATEVALGFIIFSLSVVVEGSIHEYEEGTFTPQMNSFFFHGGSEGLYAPKNATSPNGRSFIQENGNESSGGSSFMRTAGKIYDLWDRSRFLRLTGCISFSLHSLFESVIFRRTKEAAAQHGEMEQNNGMIEAIIVEIKDRERIGGSYFNSDAICCTSALAKEGSCKKGEVIIHRNPDNPDWPMRIRTSFSGNDDETKMEIPTVYINQTGMYYLYFMFCDPKLKGTVISGKTIWRNPTGYLPGKMAPLMTFYGSMSLAYLVLGLIWFLQFVRFWKDILQLQYYITVVIALGMCEMALWYFEYVNFSSTGTRPMGITIWAVTFSAVRKTVSRLLLLVVSMGFGVVRPTLGGITSKVAVLGFIYFIASEALDLFENLGNINDFSRKVRLFFVLPVAVLDACFILWIFSSLSKTLEKLQMRRSTAKLELYRKFTNCLAISVLLSVAWIGYELYFNASDPLGELWERAWLIPAFWNILAYLLLAVICVLWAPSQNSTRYAFSEEIGDDFDDEEAIALTGSGSKAPGEVREEDKIA